jgi:hypothetical protein
MLNQLPISPPHIPNRASPFVRKNNLTKIFLFFPSRLLSSLKMSFDGRSFDYSKEKAPLYISNNELYETMSVIPDK